MQHREIGLHRFSVYIVISNEDKSNVGAPKADVTPMKSLVTKRLDIRQ